VYVNAGTAGQIPYYESDGSTLSATSSLFINTQGYLGIGTSSLSQLFTVGGTSGSQFMVDENGQIVAGTWQGDILGTQYGGTGTSTDWWTGIAFVDSGTWSPTSTLSTQYGGTGLSGYTTGDILYAGNAADLARLGIGSTGQILSVVGGLPAWTSTSSLDIGTSSLIGILGVEQGGTGQDFSGTTGFIYLETC